MRTRTKHVIKHIALVACWIYAVLLLGTLRLSAQTFPVQVTTTLTRPYSPYLTDYTQPGADRFRTTSLLNETDVLPEPGTVLPDGESFTAAGTERRREVGADGNPTPNDLILGTDKDGTPAWKREPSSPRGPPVASAIDDAVLDAASRFTENLDEVAEVGVANWKQFQNKVAKQLKEHYPGKTIGNQITLEVHYLEDGVEKMLEIIPDNLVLLDIDKNIYKVIDAKTSITKDLSEMADLTRTCTKNQKVVYPMIDAIGNGNTSITNVKMKGENATRAFGNLGETGKLDINLERGIEFWVNASTTDFNSYIRRPRIK